MKITFSFQTMAQQLSLQTLGKGRNFTITNEEFESFLKSFLFEQLKDNDSLGKHFCDTYNETNYVLMGLPNKNAIEHIRKFYVK